MLKSINHINMDTFIDTYNVDMATVLAVQNSIMFMDGMDREAI